MFFLIKWACPASIQTTPALQKQRSGLVTVEPRSDSGAGAQAGQVFQTNPGLSGVQQKVSDKVTVVSKVLFQQRLDRREGLLTNV